MQNTPSIAPRRTRVRLVVDIGLFVGLLLATTVVVIADRHESQRRAKMIDVVFLLDEGPNMQTAIERMKSNCRKTVDGLTIKDCRFALVPFGGNGDADLIPSIPFAHDAEMFKKALGQSAATHGAKPAASVVEALEQALKLDFRVGVPLMFLLVTNTPCEHADQLVEIGSRMNQRKIIAVVQAEAGQKEVYLPLYRQGGRFFTIEGKDLTGTIEKSGGEAEASAMPTSVIEVMAPTNNAAGAVEVGGLYGLRRPDYSDKQILDLGGTPESQAAVAAGLEWLARHQADDGHWGPDCLGGQHSRCEAGPPCGTTGGDYPFAQTGLAILAFQAAGHFEFNETKYSKVVRQGLSWLVEHQSKDGAICPNGTRNYMYQHGMAAFALADSCAAARAMKKQPDLRFLEAARKAVAFIEDQQHDDGGWRYNPRGNSDTSVSGWQVLALKSAREAGIKVSDECVDKVRKFFRSCEERDEGRTGYTGPGNHISDATTGVGMLVHQFLLGDPDADLVKKAASYLANQAERMWGGGVDPFVANPNHFGQTKRAWGRGSGVADYYLWYNCTLAMKTAGGADWDRWNKIVRDLVIGLQKPKDAGCARGSWDPDPRWGQQGGRVYSTALAVLTLEVYYRFATVKKP